MVRWLVNRERERIRKEATMAKHETLSVQLRGGTEENLKHWVFLLRFEPRAVPLEPTCLMYECFVW